jgi:uncharacterized membrane protein YbhN (UPF0104 family)
MAATLLRSRRLREVGTAVALLLCVVLALRLRSLWHASEASFTTVHWPLAVAALLCWAIGIAAGGQIWVGVLRRVNGGVPNRALAIFFRSQLGKYVPGGVWQFAGRAAGLRAVGVPARLAAMSMTVEIAASGAAAAIVALLVLPFGVVAFGAVALILGGVVGAWSLHRRRTRLLSSAAAARLAAAAWALPLYAVASLGYGVALWLTARSLFFVPVGDLPRFAGAFALAWLAGLVAVFAPGGIGVREAALAALLAPITGEGRAILVATASRLLLTLVDAVAGSLALIPRLRARRAQDAPATTRPSSRLS